MTSGLTGFAAVATARWRAHFDSSRQRDHLVAALSVGERLPANAGVGGLDENAGADDDGTGRIDDRTLKDGFSLSAGGQAVSQSQRATRASTPHVDLQASGSCGAVRD